MSEKLSFEEWVKLNCNTSKDDEIFSSLKTFNGEWAALDAKAEIEKCRKLDYELYISGGDDVNKIT